MAPTRSPAPSRFAFVCLRAVTSATRAEAIVGDVVEDVVRRVEAGAVARPRFHIEAAVWRHVAAEAVERLPAFYRNFRFVIRDAWRGLRAAPATTALALGILSVSIAAATVTFSVVDNVVLRALPYHDSGRLARVGLQVGLMQPFGQLSGLPVFLYERLKDDSTAFTALAAMRGGTFSLPTGAEPQPVVTAFTTASLFDVLAVRPLLGQPFTVANEAAGADTVAVIGHDLWLRRFGGDPAIVGRPQTFGRRAVIVLGVMPPGFAYPIDGDRRTEIWMPFVAPDDERSGAQLSRYLSVVGRLSLGTTLAAAQDQANAILTGLVVPGPSRIDDARAVVQSLADTLLGSVRVWMLLVLAAVALVMLIACANVANLILSCATQRARELAIRTSLGASRRWLVASLLTESVMLSLSAAAVGLIAAAWGVSAARAALPAGIARTADVALDARVLIAAITAAVITGLLVGVVPAWQASRRDLVTLLKDQAASVSTGRARWRSVFLVAQVAFVGLLLVATMLFVTSFVRVTRSDLGFERRNLVTAGVSDLTSPVMDVLRALGELPGVAAAGAFTSGSAPLARAGGFGGGASGTTVSKPSAPDRDSAHVLFLGTTPGYFKAAGIQIVYGRDFTAEDLGLQDRVILDVDVARRLYRDADPVGSTVHWGDIPATIIGVVAAVRDYGPDRDPNPAIYIPAHPKRTGYQLLIRATSDPAAIVPAIRATLDRYRKPGSEPVTARPLEEAFRVITADRRFAAGLMSIFGVLALFIGAAGIYGVMTSVVAQQTREFGIRVALGAHARTILLGVVTRAARHLALGLAIGLPAAFLAARGVESVLFGVKATDIAVYLTVVVVTLAVGLLAAIVPARRAARVDPLVSLRSE